MKKTRFILLLLVSFLFTACSSEKSLGDKVKNWDPYQYSVQHGDTLYSIAWRYDLDFKALAQWNKIPHPFTIFPGQRLKMKGPEIIPAGKTYLFGSLPKPDNNLVRKPATVEKVLDYSDPDNVPKAPPLVASSGYKKSSPTISKPSNKAQSRQKKSKQNVSVSSQSAKYFTKGKLKWSWPIKGKVISTYAANNHDRKGIDIKGISGQKIKSAGRGVVVYSGGGLISYGNLIIIKHNDRFLSAYAHNKKLLVKEGTAVKKGQTIAIIGKKPNVTNLLHFEIRKDGKPVNPLLYLP